MLKRLEKDIPEAGADLKEMRWSIPYVHVNGHIIECMYAFSAAYKENAGHFQAELVEQLWVEMNRLSAFASRMNKDNRHILYTAFMSSHNHDKIMRMC